MITERQVKKGSIVLWFKGLLHKLQNIEEIRGILNKVKERCKDDEDITKEIDGCLERLDFIDYGMGIDCAKLLCDIRLAGIKMMGKEA